MRFALWHAGALLNRNICTYETEDAIPGRSAPAFGSVLSPTLERVPGSGGRRGRVCTVHCSSNIYFCLIDIRLF